MDTPCQGRTVGQVVSGWSTIPRYRAGYPGLLEPGRTRLHSEFLHSLPRSFSFLNFPRSSLVRAEYLYLPLGGTSDSLFHRCAHRRRIVVTYDEPVTSLPRHIRPRPL